MQDYLSPEGQKIYNEILGHIDKNNWSQDIDDYELSMLANAFDMYSKCAMYIKENGMTQMTKTGFMAARPECGIMKTEYANVLKHSAKFGLNPGDRKKIFKVADTKRPKKTFDLRPMREKFDEWWSSLPHGGIEPSDWDFQRYDEYVRKNRKNPESQFDLL